MKIKITRKDGLSIIGRKKSLTFTISSDLEQLSKASEKAFCINEVDSNEWSIEVTDIIDSNGWQDITGEERGVCIDAEGNEMVVINDNGQAEINYDPKSWYGIED